jgi:lipopolysaccharide export system ATP-binding protein
VAGSINSYIIFMSDSIEQVDHSGLEVKNIAKSYGKRLVIRDISLSLKRGEVVAVLGPNGAGKTTCFYIITGLIKPDRGQILMDGIDITGLPMYRRARIGVGYLPQEASIFRGLSVQDNILAILEVHEPIHKRRLSMLDELLEEFSITHIRTSPAMALSGGERRRVEIARALASRPSFMLFDEPLAGIDPIAVGDVRNLILHLKNRGIGVLITDHNVRETLSVVDRAYIIHDGTVISAGTPDEIISDENVRRVYLGEEFSL